MLMANPISLQVWESRPISFRRSSSVCASAASSESIYRTMTRRTFVLYQLEQSCQRPCFLTHQYPRPQPG